MRGAGADGVPVTTPAASDGDPRSRWFAGAGRTYRREQTRARGAILRAAVDVGAFPCSERGPDDCRAALEVINPPHAVNRALPVVQTLSTKRRSRTPPCHGVRRPGSQQRQLPNLRRRHRLLIKPPDSQTFSTDSCQAFTGRAAHNAECWAGSR